MSTVPSQASVDMKQLSIEEILKSSFLDYAVSVIISRALPDVRDGLKPVHRRILYSMQQSGFFHNRPYHKSARIVGEVMAKFHPHGNEAIYQTMVGMVQDFFKRYPLLDGQGNWGSIDGDNAAAFRYTEVRMDKISQEILADISKDTINFVPNFDESTVEPVILPSKIPLLLINGTAGIAVGMATAIPPHNIGEVVDGCIALLKNENITDEELFDIIPGPDFPLGGIIYGKSGILRSYKEGRGSIVVRGVIDTEETAKGIQLIVSQLPYQVIKADLIIKIAELVREKTIEGISNIRDESSRDGMRIVIELKRDAYPETVINQLYKHTQLQNNFNTVMLALLDNKPQLFTLRKILLAFLDHRRVVIVRRTKYDCAKAEHQDHVLAGFEKVIANIEKVVDSLKNSKNTEDALQMLQKDFGLSEIQSRSTLDLRLQRLTSMEQEKITIERAELAQMIKKLKGLLAHPELIDQEIINELVEIREKYADTRRTKIFPYELNDFNAAALIPDEEVAITLTRRGYIKRVTLSTYDIQHRGGKGKMGIASLEESNDIIQDIFVAKNHDELLFFTNLGRVYKKSVYEIPEVSRTAKGRAIVNVLPLTENETVVKLLCARQLSGLNLVMVTKRGTIKRCDADEFVKIRQTGIRAITLDASDELVFCALSSGSDSIILATMKGQGIRFKEKEVRVMGRQAGGVRGIRLHDNDEVVGLQVVADDRDILFATENGYGKRVKVADFRVAHRGGSGVRTIPTEGRNGLVIGLAIVDNESDMLLIDQQGKIIRLSPSEIRTLGRQAQGVRLIRLDESQKLASVAVMRVNETEDVQARKAENILVAEDNEDAFVDDERESDLIDSSDE